MTDLDPDGYVPTMNERLTVLNHDGKRETFLIEWISEDDTWLHAHACDRDGNRSGHYRKDETLVLTERYIMKECILRRVRMVAGRRYGELVPADKVGLA